MTKTPGEVEPFKPPTKEQRNARKAFRQIEANQAMTDHAIAQKAFHTNHERLKAERLREKLPPARRSRQKMLLPEGARSGGARSSRVLALFATCGGKA